MSQVHPHHGAHHHPAQVFTVWKKALLFSGTGYTVFDSSGNLILRAENYTPNVNRQLLLMDATGKPLLLLRRKVMSLHHRWEGFICNEADGHGSCKKRVFSIKRSSIISATTAIDVFVSSSPTHYLRRQCDYHIEGSFRDRSGAIYNRSRTMVAQVKRKRGNCEILLEKDVFSLVVYPGFDPALIMSWIVVVDHINREDLRRFTQAALHCTFRSSELLKIVYINRKGECTGEEVEALKKNSLASNSVCYQTDLSDLCAVFPS